MMSDLFDEADAVINDYREWKHFGGFSKVDIQMLSERSEAMLEKLAQTDFAEERDRYWRHIYCTNLMHQSDDLMKYLAEIEMSAA